MIPCDATSAFLPFGSAAITVAVDADVRPARLLVFALWDAALIYRVLAEGSFAWGPPRPPVHVRRHLVAVDFAPAGLVLRERIFGKLTEGLRSRRFSLLGAKL